MVLCPTNTNLPFAPFPLSCFPPPLPPPFPFLGGISKLMSNYLDCSDLSFESLRINQVSQAAIFEYADEGLGTNLRTDFLSADLQLWKSSLCKEHIISFSTKFFVNLSWEKSWESELFSDCGHGDWSIFTTTSCEEHKQGKDWRKTKL